MHNDEICSVCVCLLYFVLCVCDNKQTHSTAEEDAVGEQLKWMQLGRSLIWPCEISARQRPLLHKARQSRGLCQTHAAPPEFCTVKSWRCRTAHVGKQRAVVGVGAIREQVASERATCRAVLFWYVYQMFCVLCLDSHAQTRAYGSLVVCLSVCLSVTGIFVPLMK